MGYGVEEVIDIIMTGEIDICLFMGYFLISDNSVQEVIAVILYILLLVRKVNKWQGGCIRFLMGGLKVMVLRGIGMIQVGVDVWLLREILNVKIIQVMESQECFCDEMLYSGVRGV